MILGLYMKMIAPVECRMRQWLGNCRMIGHVECTSLVIHIAWRIGALENALVAYIECPILW